MKPKAKIKTAADILMTAAMPVLMCYSIVGEKAHEVVGVTMFCLFILHLILNIGWIKALFKGKYPLKRIVGTLINATVMICMLGLMYSSLVISKHIFTFIRLSGTMNARTIHLLCAYWGLVLMSVHLGMHISQIAARLMLKGKALILTLRILFGAISVVGVYEFIQLKFMDYLFGKVQFVFIGTSASILMTLLEYTSVMLLFTSAGYLMEKLVSIHRGKSTS